MPNPTEIRLHAASRQMEIHFDDDSHFKLSYEFLRVHSPSAEVRGHGPGQETLQTGKRNVDITGVQPVGNYAVQLSFSDGHNTGIYSWELLYHYGMRQAELWAEYLGKLKVAGASRE